MIYPHEVRERQPCQHAINVAEAQRREEAERVQQAFDLLTVIVSLHEMGLDAGSTIERARELLNAKAATLVTASAQQR